MEELEMTSEEFHQLAVESLTLTLHTEVVKDYIDTKKVYNLCLMINRHKEELSSIKKHDGFKKFMDFLKEEQLRREEDTNEEE